MLEKQKAIIHKLWQAGKTQNESCQGDILSAWNITKITRRTCSKWYNCGFKPQTKVTDERQINLFLTVLLLVVKFSKPAGVAVSGSTTVWRLHHFRYDSRVPILKPLLTFKQKLKLSIWARDHSNWSVNQWNQVIFSNESRFYISYGERGPGVWRKSSERYDEKCSKKA